MQTRSAWRSCSGGFHPGNDDAVGADVEGPLDQPAVEFREANQGDRLATRRGSEMFDNFFPIEMAVLRVDDDPIDAERHRHLGDARRLEGDPEAENRLIVGELMGVIC